MKPDRFRRLRAAIEPSRKKLAPAREELSRVLRQYVGKHYFEGAPDCRPINMLELAVTTYLEALSSQNPQVLAITHASDLQPNAAEFELAINEQLKRMDFSSEHRIWVLCALFSVGIMKTALEVVSNPVVDDEPLPDTRVFCEAIMLDDWVHDCTASKWGKQVTFCGNLYRMRLEEAKENENFDPEMRKKLRSPSRHGGEERIEEISKGSGSHHEDEFTDMVELWDIWVPEENEIVTFAAENGDKPLRTVKWRGPASGPYRFLGFNVVLNNIFPLPPAANWIDLDDLINELYSQLGKQASRQKTIGLATVQGANDATRIIDAPDGTVVSVDNPGAFKEARFGGIDQQNLGFAMNAMMQCDKVMGNLNSLAGLGTSAGTLGQEKLIKDSSSDRMRAMQIAVATATRQVIEDVAFWMFNHPTIDLSLKRRIKGTDIELETSWPYQENEWGFEEDVRQSGFDKYKISIQPYSMQDLSPGQRIQLLRDLWQRDILPLTQFGLQPDISAYMALIAKYSDLPELLELVPDAKYSQMPQGEARKSPVTDHTYRRENVSLGRTPAAQQQQEAMMMLAGGQSGQGAT